MITVERVKAAYEKAGIKPKSGDFCGEGCGCILTALLVGEGHIDFPTFRAWMSSALDESPVGMSFTEFVNKKLGLDANQMWSVIDGFDGLIGKPSDYYNLGAECRKELLQI
jgi:hypothetical protein